MLKCDTKKWTHVVTTVGKRGAPLSPEVDALVPAAASVKGRGLELCARKSGSRRARSSFRVNSSALMAAEAVPTRKSTANNNPMPKYCHFDIYSNTAF